MAQLPVHPKLVGVHENARHEDFHRWCADMIALSEFAVEANSNERQTLWETWHDRLTWEEVGLGCTEQIGMLDGRPINIALTWGILNDHLICFYYGCSQLVDHKLIEEWIVRRIAHSKTPNGYSRQCDAMNFHHCLHGLEIRTKISQKEQHGTTNTN